MVEVTIIMKKKIMFAVAAVCFSMGGPARAESLVLGDEAGAEALSVVDGAWPAIKAEKDPRTREYMQETGAGIYAQLGAADKSPWQPADVEGKCIFRLLSMQYWMLRGDYQKADGLASDCLMAQMLRAKVRLAVEPLHGKSPEEVKGLAPIVRTRIESTWKEIQKNETVFRGSGAYLALARALIGDKDTSRKWFDALEKEVGITKQTGDTTLVDAQTILFDAELYAGFFERYQQLAKLKAWDPNPTWSAAVLQRDKPLLMTILARKDPIGWAAVFHAGMVEESDWSLEWGKQEQERAGFLCSVGEEAIAALKAGNDRDDKVDVVAQTWVMAGEPARGMTLLEKYRSGEDLQKMKVELYKLTFFPQGWPVRLDGPTRAKWVADFAAIMRKDLLPQLRTGAETLEELEQLIGLELEAGNVETARWELWMYDKQIPGPGQKNSPGYDEAHENDMIGLAGLWRMVGHPERATQWVKRALAAPRFGDEQLSLSWANAGYWDMAALFVNSGDTDRDASFDQGRGLMELWKKRHGESFPTWINILPLPSRLDYLHHWAWPREDRAASDDPEFLFHMRRD